MNIFFLDRDPETVARFHSDQHIVKMVLETAQILCAALFRHGIAAPYKPTHARHPSVLWAGDSLSHWLWTRRLGLELGAEYTFRRDRVHASAEIIAALRLADGEFTIGRFEEAGGAGRDHGAIGVAAHDVAIVIDLNAGRRLGQVE